MANVSATAIHIRYPMGLDAWDACEIRDMVARVGDVAEA